MQITIPFASCTLGAALLLALGTTPLTALAQTAAKAAAHPAAKGAATKAAGKAVAPKDVPLPEPTPEQQKAADLVYYGLYECEFNQNVHIQASPQHLFYVDLKSGNRAWLMKPVLSQTGAVRLEDVRGETLMVQIASKSMLLNVKTGQRIVDACVSPRQRELMEAAKAKKADDAPVLLTGDAAASAATPVASATAASAPK